MVLHKLFSWRMPAATIAFVAVLAAALMFGRAPTPTTAQVPPTNVHSAVYDAAFHHDGLVSVIIQAAGNTDAVADAVSSVGGEVTQRYRIIPALEATIPVDAIDELAGRRYVRHISVNASIEAAEEGSELDEVVTELEEVSDTQLATITLLQETLAGAQTALVEAEARALTAAGKDLKVAEREVAKAQRAVEKAQNALDKALQQQVFTDKKQAEREAKKAARDAERAQRRMERGDRKSLYGDQTPRGFSRKDYRDLASVFPSVVGATDAWDEGINGAGVGIAIIDSGIKTGATTDFGDRVAVNHSVVGGATDSQGHGTHVAGVAAGNGANSDERFMGIAPGASLIGVQVGHFKQGVTLGDALLGLEWVLDNKDVYNIRVANLSFTQSIPESYLISPLDAAVEQLWFNGIVVVVAQGNRGGEVGAVNHPPANDPFVVSVGAYSDNATVEIEDDYAKQWSSQGVTMEGFSKPEIVAPGDDLIATAGDGNSILYQEYAEKRVGAHYLRMSGTSAAAPVVSGVAALILQQNPDLTPNQVKARIVNNATPLAGSNAPRVNAYAAVFGPDQGLANQGIPMSFVLDPRPLMVLLVAGYLQTQVEAGAITWDSSTWDSITWDTIDWDSITWDTINWDSITWDSITWDAITWDSITWDSITWDSITWDSITWDSITWDSITWDSITWDSITWDSITWDSITWDSITWDSITWDSITWDSITWDSITWDSITWDSITWDAITWDAILTDE